MIMRFKEFLARPKKIWLEIPDYLLSRLTEQLDEATRATVGNYTARRDPPHFQGDEYHAHVAIPGGYEVPWGKSGSRRHLNKCPAEVPRDAKSAVAKVLDVDVNLLETFIVHDEAIDEDVFLVEIKNEP